MIELNKLFIKKMAFMTTNDKATQHRASRFAYSVVPNPVLLPWAGKGNWV